MRAFKDSPVMEMKTKGLEPVLTNSDLLKHRHWKQTKPEQHV